VYVALFHPYIGMRTLLMLAAFGLSMAAQSVAPAAARQFSTLDFRCERYTCRPLAPRGNHNQSNLSYALERPSSPSPRSAI